MPDVFLKEPMSHKQKEIGHVVLVIEMFNVADDPLQCARVSLDCVH